MENSLRNTITEKKLLMLQVFAGAISCKFVVRLNIRKDVTENKQEGLFGNLKMKLKIINSNSSGNSYLLEASDGQQLCIEAGRPLKEVKKVANLKTSRCVGVIISHSHG